MHRSVAALALLIFAPLAPAADKPEETRLFELRVYTATKGKLDTLHARFRDHTVKLFEKHGMTNIGYWVPIDNTNDTLYYLLAHKDKVARDASFKAFGADPDWKSARDASEKDGKIVQKAEFYFLSATDYSPPIKASQAKEKRVFELRWYFATPGNLEDLNARFRNDTVKLFEKHGMTNLWYTNIAKGEKNADTELIYMLAHKSQEDGLKSFEAFREDPDWIAARKASENKAKGPLTVKDGVRSIYMKATDYSPTK